MLAITPTTHDRGGNAARRKPLDEGRIHEIADSIARQGVACIPAYFSEEQLREALDRLQGDASGVDQGEILSRHFASHDVLDLCAAICRRIDRRYDEARDHKQVLRYLTSRSPEQHFYYFHFDSYRLTIIAPLRMPTTEQRGDLMIFPNLRRSRTSYLINILDKALYDSRLMQRHRKRQALRGGQATRVEMIPGNIYLIDGSRTLHANGAIDPGEIRATLVFHFAETHRDHWIRTLRHRLRGRR